VHQVVAGAVRECVMVEVLCGEGTIPTNARIALGSRTQLQATGFCSNTKLCETKHSDSWDIMLDSTFAWNRTEMPKREPEDTTPRTRDGLAQLSVQPFHETAYARPPHTVHATHAV
jgi:hypothetical protein